MPNPAELFKKGVVYQLRDMEKTIVQKDIVYACVNGRDLHFDVYSPSNMAAEAKRPAVVLIHGEAPLHNLKDAGQYQSLGRLIAASGIIAVSFDRRTIAQGAAIGECLEDITNLIGYLRQDAARFGIDESKLALWSISAGVPFGFHVGMRNGNDFIKCLVAYYGFGDFATYGRMLNNERFAHEAENYSPLKLLTQNPATIPPILIARAGLDNPLLNESLDGFIAKTLEKNISVDIYNHPTGHHAFDVLDDNARSREIIAKTLDFLKDHLLN